MGSGEGVGVDGISDDEESVSGGSVQCDAGERSSRSKHIRKMCLVGDAANDEQLVALLQDHFCAEVFKSESGAEYMNDADMVFLCSSFGGRHFKELRSHGKLIVGPSIVRTCAAKSKPLIKPQANRPLYSDSMAGITVALVGIPKKKCLEAVDLVHFMGGSTRRKFSPSVTHLISESAMGAEYRAAVSRRCSVVHLKWLNVAWALRNNVGASVTAIDFVKNFLVEPFCGLSIWFLGYSEDELVHLRRAVVEHMGEIAERQQSATHIVVSNKFNALVDDFGCEQYIVANEWLWASLRLECCANEEDFQWRQKVGQEKAQVSRCAKSFLRSLTDARETNSSVAASDYSDQDSSADCLRYSKNASLIDGKLYGIFEEMLETEKHYLGALKLIIKRFKEPLETQLRNKEWKMLSKAEVKCLFSRVEPLICMHETIYNDLKAAIVSRNAVHRFSKVWLDNAVNLRSLYSAYVNNYDAAIETLKQCDRSRPAFHAFLKEAESNADCQRQMLKDLLMRPVQRLPSVMLLLKEMYRKVKKDNRGKKYLLRAINALDDILRTVNESKCQMDSYAEILNICSEIEHCPADLLSSSRTPLGRIHVVSLGGGRNEWTNLRGKTMVIFLFNDLVEIAKTRNIVTDELPSETTITSNALMPPFLSLRSDKKKYKHQKQYMITTIQRIHVIIDDDFDGVFVLSLKGTDEEDFWIAQCLENRSGEMRKFLDDLCIQLYYLCGRVVEIEVLRLDVDLQFAFGRRAAAVVHTATRYASSFGEENS